MWKVEMVIPGRPQPKQRHRSGKGHNYTPAKTRQWEQRAKDLMNAYMLVNGLKLADFPLRLEVYVIYNLLKKHDGVHHEWHAVVPDSDNLIKAVKDAGNKVLWRDDCLICHETTIKIYGFSEFVYIMVNPLPKFPEMFVGLDLARVQKVYENKGI